MNEPDQGFMRSLRDIAADAPGRESVLSAVRVGYRRRVVQRRWLATGSVAVVVLIVAGATTLLPTRQAGTAHEAHPPVVSMSSTDPAAASGAGFAGVTKEVTSGAGAAGIVASRRSQAVSEASSAAVAAEAAQSAARASAVDTSVRPTGATSNSLALPANSPFVAAPAPNLSSPVSVPDSWTSYDTNGPDISAGPGYLIANWLGQSPTAMQTLDVSKGTTGTGKYRGYMVTDAQPSLNVFAPGYDTKSVKTSITVNGHAAEYLTAPKGSFEARYATPAAARIGWQLGDGRWIQVWAVGEDQSTLTAFASSISEQKTEFPADLSIGLTLKGMTAISVNYSSTNGPNLTACPAGMKFGSDTSNCVSAFADHRSFAQVLSDFEGFQSVSPAQVQASASMVEVDGRSITVNTAAQIGMVKSGKLTLAVWVNSKTKLSASELATLASTLVARTGLAFTDIVPITETAVTAPSTN